MSNKEYIQLLLRTIEQQLAWGSSEKWIQRDYENLIEQIFEKTRVNLSLSTLKRIWKGDYKQLPNIATLDALTRFAGYLSWQDYKVAAGAENSLADEQNEIQELSSRWRKNIIHMRWSVFLVLILTSVSLGYWFLIRSSEIAYHPEDFELTLQAVSDEVPNTVFFRIKLPADIKDTVWLHQNWDSRRREALQHTDTLISSIYYTPGYYKTKLVVNDSVMQEVPLQVYSKGWKSAVFYDLFQLKSPVYIPLDYAIRGNEYHISPEVLKQYRIDMSKEFWVGYMLSQDFGNLQSTDFSFEVSVKNPEYDGGHPCQDVWIYLVFRDNFGLIPLCDSGCVSNLYSHFCGNYRHGKKADLSEFGTDLNDWVKVRFEAKGGYGKIFFNGELRSSFKYEAHGGELKYITLYTKGTGYMKEVKLFDAEGNALEMPGLNAF